MKNQPLFLVLLFGSVCAVLPAQSPGEKLTLKISVSGPGDELYFWWGHIALVIEDNRTKQSRFYDYGLFSFDNENFFYNFAFGRLLYSCGVSNAASNMAVYIHTNRDITLYTLDVPPENRLKVLEFAETNVLPENRDYYYHHFRDNCSTRIRDILDIATDGQFKTQYGDAPGRFTFRQHVRRHTWFSPFFDWVLNFLMGQDIDVPITVWQEMFLPSEVGKRITEFSYTGPGGVMRPLVTGTEIVNRAVGRPHVLDYPRKQWPRELCFGVAVMVLLAFFYYLQRKTAAGQILLGLSQSLIGLFFGIAALLLYFMSLFTNHDYTYHNMNMIFASPLLLVAVPLGIRYAFASSPEARIRNEIALRLLWLLVLLGIIVSMLLKPLPNFWQANLVDEMLLLPIALILSLEPIGLKDSIGRIFRRWTS
jgi:hypothetical protein